MLVSSATLHIDFMDHDYGEVTSSPVSHITLWCDLQDIYTQGNNRNGLRSLSSHHLKMQPEVPNFEDSLWMSSANSYGMPSLAQCGGAICILGMTMNEELIRTD